MAIYLTVTISLISTKYLHMMTNGCPPEDTMLYWTTVKVTPTTMCFLAYILYVINLYIGESHTKKETLVHKYIFLYSWCQRGTFHTVILASVTKKKPVISRPKDLQWTFFLKCSLQLVQDRLMVQHISWKQKYHRPV